MLLQIMSQVSELLQEQQRREEIWKIIRTIKKILVGTNREEIRLMLDAISLVYEERVDSERGEIRVS